MKNMIATLLALTLLTIPVVSHGQEGAEETVDRNGILSRVSAGVWCPILSTRSNTSNSDDGSGQIVDTDEDGIPDTFVENSNTSDNSTLECDVGLGVYLAGKKFDQGTLGLVGGLGSKSVVFGLAWIFRGQEDNSLSIAIAAGLGASYNTSGIYTDDAGIVIGTNLSLSGAQLSNIVGN